VYTIRCDDELGKACQASVTLEREDECENGTGGSGNPDAELSGCSSPKRSTAVMLIAWSVSF